MTPQSPKDWEEEFRKRFTAFDEFPCENGQSCHVKVNEVIQFIQEVVNQTRLEERERIKKEALGAVIDSREMAEEVLDCLKRLREVAGRINKETAKELEEIREDIERLKSSPL